MFKWSPSKWSTRKLKAVMQDKKQKDIQELKQKVRAAKGDPYV